MAAAYEAWLPEVNVRADLTAKRGIYVTKPDARSLRIWLPASGDLISGAVCRAMNRLNGTILGRQAQHRWGPRAPRLSAMAWIERGKQTGSPHVHLLVERPLAFDQREFAEALERAWRSQDISHRECLVQAIEDNGASFRYNAKASSTMENLVYFHKELRERAWWRQEALGLSSPDA